MPKPIPLPRGVNDLSNRAFGRLTVLEYLHTEHAHAIWRCRCECGTEIEARGQQLVSGRVVSCGCFRRDPEVRQGARMKVPARRRKEIARMGQAAKRDSDRQTPNAMRGKLRRRFCFCPCD